MVDRAALDHRQDRVAIAFGVTLPFEQDHTTAFPATITIRRAVKTFAAPIGSQRAHLREGDMGKGCEDQVDAAGQGQVTFAQAQTLTGQV